MKNQLLKKTIKEVVLKPPIEENIKITQLVKCNDCGKMMTNKSLKYSHKNKCSANKSLDPEVKNKKRNSR